MSYTKFEGYVVRDVDGAGIPLDPMNTDCREYLAWVAEGNQPAPPTIPLQRRIELLLQRVDVHLNAAAKAKGYDSIARAALRSAYAGPWQAEGLAFAQWMDAVYAHCYELLAQFQAGELDEPTPETLIDMLPKLELP